MFWTPLSTVPTSFRCTVLGMATMQSKTCQQKPVEYLAVEQWQSGVQHLGRGQGMAINALRGYWDHC